MIIYEKQQHYNPQQFDTNIVQKHNAFRCFTPVISKAKRTPATLYSLLLVNALALNMLSVCSSVVHRPKNLSNQSTGNPQPIRLQGMS